MSTKVALIVDDSKTAQIRLRRILEKYDTSIEVAFSAEQALTMLPELCPDIIFLDHSMDGMDGLEALKIIKGNPETATTPVIMYTAQSDDLYISQARALGALDTLSKDIFKPSNIDALMVRLHIPRRGEAVEQATAESLTLAVDDPANLPEDSSGEQSLSNSQMLAALADAENPYAGDGSVVPSSGKADKLGEALFGIKRLLGVQAHQIGDLKEKFDGMTLDYLSLDGMPLAVLQDDAKKERLLLRRRANTAILFTLVCVALLGLFLVYFGKRFDVLTDNVSELGKMYEQAGIQSKNIESRLAPADVASESRRSDLGRFIETLNWLSSIDMHFGYEESPLNARQVQGIQELIERLSESGFTGTVGLNIHFGNFCLKAEPVADEWQLAGDDMVLAGCTFYEDIKAETVPEAYLSIPYIQFEESSISILSGEIQVNLDLAGFNEPTLRYPELNTISTAREWNAIAARNNRLTIDFLSGAE